VISAPLLSATPAHPPAAQPSPLTRPRRSSDLAAWLVLLTVLALVLLATMRSPEKDDVAWLLYVARKWLAGQRLYEDLVEVNPPLIIWLYAIPAWLAGVLHVPPKLIAVPGFAALVLGAAWWTAGLLRGQGAMFARRVPVFSAIGTLLLVLPGVEFGQREHLMAASVLPYLAAMAIWLNGGQVSRRQGIAVGIVAGLGCALKPTYALAFVLPEIEGWLRGRLVLRAAPLAAVAAALAYASAILVFCPAFLAHAVPLALALYGGTDTAPLELAQSAGSLLFGDAVLGLLWLLCYRGSAARKRFIEALFTVLAAFAVGATIVYFLQGKNWFYHRIPAIVAIVLGLMVWAIDMLPSMLRSVRPWQHSRGLACACLALITITAFVREEAHRMRPWIKEAVEPDLSTEVRLEQIIKREHARTYLAFSEWIGLGFPVVNNTGVVWTSRFDSMWALRGEMWREHQDGHEPKDFPISHWVARDFIKGCPDIAVVDARGGINFVGVLVASDADFAKAWTHYRQIAMFDGLRVLKRQGAGCGDAKTLPRIASAALPSP
jgi:hypothetical protein